MTISPAKSSQPAPRMHHVAIQFAVWWILRDNMSARDRAGASASRGNGLARALSSLDSRFEVRETTSGSTVVASRREPLAGFKEEEAEPAPATPLEPLSDGQYRHVVITGCDSGFGNAVALRVAKLPGYRVHALCLLADSVASLSALGVAGCVHCVQARIMCIVCGVVCLTLLYLAGSTPFSAMSPRTPMSLLQQPLLRARRIAFGRW